VRQTLLKTGDRVRVIAVPVRLPVDELKTRELFELCLGKVFPIAGFNQFGMLELEVGEVRRKAACAETIWIEPDYVELEG
jgi:hypothetical protein